MGLAQVVGYKTLACLQRGEINVKIESMWMRMRIHLETHTRSQMEPEAMGYVWALREICVGLLNSIASFYADLSLENK